MPYKQGDRIFETGDCAGTGDVFVQGAFNGLYKTFLSALLDGDTTTILIESTVASEAEVCDATWQAASGRLVRGNILWSTQPDNGRVPFLVGTKRVMMTESIKRVVLLDPTGLATIPLLTVTTTALMPTPLAADDSQKAATTAWVRANTTTALTPYATTAYVDAADALKAPLASPAFTGNPTAPTPAPGDSDMSIATTGFVAAAITALNLGTTYAPIASPTFTGDPKAPTPPTTDNDTSIATTAFVRLAINMFSPPPDLSGYAPLASPAFTGNPTAPTPVTGDNDTSIATTAFVKAQDYATNTDLALKAPLASPALTGNPTAPTQTAGDNTTKLATTAFVAATIAANPSGAYIGTSPPPGAVPQRLWWHSELGQMFVLYQDANSTQWVPAAPAVGPPAGTPGDFYAINPQVLTTSYATLVFATVSNGNASGAYNPANGRYTPPAGRYAIVAVVNAQNASGIHQSQIKLRKNGVDIPGAVATASSAGATYWAETSLSVTVDCNGTDYIDVQGISSGNTPSAQQGWFGAIPVGVVIAMPQMPGALALYSENVLAAPASQIIVTCPVGAKRVELQLDAQLTGATNDNIWLQVMQSGTPFAGAAYSVQQTLGQNTVNGAQATVNSASGWFWGNGIRMTGLMTGSLAPGWDNNGVMMTGTFGSTRPSDRLVYSNEWDLLSTGIRSTVTGFRVYSQTAINFLAGSSLRCHVVV